MITQLLILIEILILYQTDSPASESNTMLIIITIISNYQTINS